MFCSRYVPLVKREMLAHEYLDLRRGTTEITKMFTERDMFCPKFAAFEQAHMTRYLSMIKTNIR